jgi:hypothetical protein
VTLEQVTERRTAREAQLQTIRAMNAPAPQPPDYAAHTTLKARQLRLLMLWESCEAMKLKQETLERIAAPRVNTHPIDVNPPARALREALALESVESIAMARQAGLETP